MYDYKLHQIEHIHYIAIDKSMDTDFVKSLHYDHKNKFKEDKEPNYHVNWFRFLGTIVL